LAIEPRLVSKCFGSTEYPFSRNNAKLVFSLDDARNKLRERDGAAYPFQKPKATSAIPLARLRNREPTG